MKDKFIGFSQNALIVTVLYFLSFALSTIIGLVMDLSTEQVENGAIRDMAFGLFFIFLSMYFYRKRKQSKKRYNIEIINLKQFAINSLKVFGFGILSAIASFIYVALLPYAIKVFALGLGDGWHVYLHLIMPNGLFVFIAGWLFACGVYFFKPKLENAAKSVIILNIAMNILIITISFFTK